MPRALRKKASNMSHKQLLQEQQLREEAERQAAEANTAMQEMQLQLHALTTADQQRAEQFKSMQEQLQLMMNEIKRREAEQQKAMAELQQRAVVLSQQKADAEAALQRSLAQHQAGRAADSEQQRQADSERQHREADAPAAVGETKLPTLPAMQSPRNVAQRINISPATVQSNEQSTQFDCGRCDLMAIQSHSAQSAPYNRSVPFIVTMDQLPKYSADSKTQAVQSWLARVEEDAILNQWTPEEQFIAAKRALTGTAKRWLDGQRGLLSYGDLRAGLQREFGRRITLADLHEALCKRKKRREETVLAYVHDMEFLGSQGNLATEEIRNYIIRGVTEEAGMRVTLASATSRSHFIDLLETYEKEMKQSEAAQKPAPTAVENLMTYPKPKNVKKMQRFFGQATGMIWILMATAKIFPHRMTRRKNNSIHFFLVINAMFCFVLFLPLFNSLSLKDIGWVLLLYGKRDRMRAFDVSGMAECRGGGAIRHHTRDGR